MTIRCKKKKKNHAKRFVLQRKKNVCFDSGRTWPFIRQPSLGTNLFSLHFSKTNTVGIEKGVYIVAPLIILIYNYFVRKNILIITYKNPVLKVF